MSMRMVVPPPWESIVLRSLGSGAFLGAGTGAIALIAASLIAVALEHDASILGPAILFSLVAAIVGALVGAACGLVGGITLSVLRRRAAASRAAARLVAGSGAALLPGVWSLVNHTDPFAADVGLSLAIVNFVIGVAIGPRVLYGKPRRRAAADRSPATPQG
jgi:hypothetical protein